MAFPTRLAKHLKAKKLSYAEFARQLSKRLGAPVCRMSVWRWAHGERYPETHYALAIDGLTDGEIPASYWASIRTQIRGHAPHTKSVA